MVSPYCLTTPYNLTSNKFDGEVHVTPESKFDDRLDALESHIAHQDVTIQELSDVALKQWRVIEQLTTRIERLEGQLRAGEAAIDRPPGAEPPPPHY
jgi:SlyX protein